MKRTLVTLLITATAGLTAIQAAAHCQIPCGIYGDTARFLTLGEHLQTLEKSVRMISELEKASTAADLNQLVRWIENKETHADAVAEIATEYFLKQRIKRPKGDDKAALARYHDQLEALHGILVSTMKIKQTVDMAQVKQLAGHVHTLAEVYLPEDQRKQLAEHHQH